MFKDNGILHVSTTNTVSVGLPNIVFFFSRFPPWTWKMAMCDFRCGVETSGMFAYMSLISEQFT